MKIVMLFPGYSSQFVGMGKELYDEYRIVQEYFDQASNCLDINFVKLCFASSDTEIGKMKHGYASIFLISCAISAVLKDQGIIPNVVAGYNQGEYAALYAAHGISFADGLYLLNKFALFYEEALQGMDVVMIRIKGVTTEALQNICLQASYNEFTASIALYNDTEDHIVSGNRQAIDNVRELVAEQYPEAKIDEVPLEFGLHSPLMDQVKKNFAMYLEKVDFKDLEAPLVCGLDGKLVLQGEEVKKRVIEHINSPIMWTRILDALEVFDFIIEVGPGSTLSKQIKKHYPDKRYMTINKPSDIEKLKMMIPKTKIEETVEE